jgi:hypothetical protein
MRHNHQNSRHSRGGRRSGGGHHSHGGNGSSSGGHYNPSGGQSRRVINPRVHTFDSNGPDVRIRGNAYQINEKYLTLARDAASAGDRILAESYLQHAEHYQRAINEMTEEFNQQQQSQNQYQQGQQPQPYVPGTGVEIPAAEAVQQGGGQQQNSLNDLDQGFLVGPRHESTEGAAVQKRDNDGSYSPVGKVTETA